MDEVLTFLNYKRGDRLGHGMALGHDVDYYFKIKGLNIYCSIESYLDDIVWMYYFISRYENSNLKNGCESVLGIPVHRLLHFLEREFERVRSKVPDLKVSMYDYYCAYMLRGDNPELYTNNDFRSITASNFEETYSDLIKEYSTDLNHQSPFHKEAFSNSEARDFYFRYHYSNAVKKWHDTMLSVTVSEEYVCCVKLVQRLLHHKVYEMEIGIETNPSSNRKISFVKKYSELPFLTFNKNLLQENVLENLSISINTDDSAVFQTDLSLEFSYIVAALFREGFDKEKVYQYIEYIKELGHYQSFVGLK